MINRNNILLFIASIFFSLKVYSQNLIFKHECYIGEEVHSQKTDTINSKEKVNLNFYSNYFKEFVPSYFPDDFGVKKGKTNIPLISIFENVYKVEYFNENNLLLKYSIDDKTNPNSDISIFYLESGLPYKLIEYFPDLHHSTNGLFSIQYDLKYNDNNELIQIEKVDNFDYKCQLRKIN